MISFKKTGIVTTCICFMAGAFLMAPNAVAADNINITFPADRGVFQRNADNNADITVKAVCNTHDTVKAIIEGEGLSSDWVELKKNDEVYEGVIKAVNAGGWYELTVATFDAAGNETGRTEIEHIGVGEVFITGGQSNSCNFGEEKTEAESDLVSAYVPQSDTWQHCEDSQPNNSGFHTGNGGGSAWPTLGDALVEKLNVPVGFYSTGRGSAKISELCNGFYGTIKEGIEKIKPYGCRAFILHQGEADTNDTPNEEYLADLKKLIDMSREDAGYDINWFIAQVSYAWSNYNNTSKMEAMKATQRAACNNYNIFVGPTTDDLLGDYRAKDNLHLSKKGLVEHGTRWAEVITEKLFTPYKLEADGVANGTIEQCSKELYAGTTYKLTAKADKGYYLVPGSIRVTGSEGEISLNDDSFIMRAEDLKVTAEFAALPAHFAKITEAVDKAKQINASEYEQAGITALNQAIEAAEKVYANPAATEAETSKAAADVDNAVKALVKKQTTQTTVDKGNNNNNNQTPAPDTVSQAVTKGKTYNSGNIVYFVTSTDKLTVEVKSIVKNKSSVVIPKSVKIAGKSYKVTSIAKNAFTKASKLKKVTIKSTTLSKIDKNAFKKVRSKVQVKVPKNKLKVYQKMLKKAGISIKKIKC